MRKRLYVEYESTDEVRTREKQLPQMLRSRTSGYRLMVISWPAQGGYDRAGHAVNPRVKFSIVPVQVGVVDEGKSPEFHMRGMEGHCSD